MEIIEDLKEGDVELTDLPQFLVMYGEVAKGSLGVFEVVTSIVTVQSVDGGEESRGGVVLVFTPEDAIAFATQLRSIASTITTMDEQVKRYEDGQALLQSNETIKEEEIGKA